MLCTRCGKRPAVVFVTNNSSKDAPTVGYCLSCAKELGIKPVEDLISKMGISDEDLETVQDQMNNLMQGGDLSQLMESLGADNLAEQMDQFAQESGGSDDDDFSHGAPAFPAPSSAFCSGTSSATPPVSPAPEPGTPPTDLFSETPMSSPGCWILGRDGLTPSIALKFPCPLICLPPCFVTLYTLNSAKGYALSRNTPDFSVCCIFYQILDSFGCCRKRRPNRR